MRTPLDTNAEVRHLAQQELRRGRPLLIVIRSASHNSPGANESDGWSLGFDHQVMMEENKRPEADYVEWKDFYSAENLSMTVFYGPGNQRNVSIQSSELEKIDKNGSLIQSILGINAPGKITSEETEGIGLIAACMEAGLIKAASTGEAKTLIQMLSPETRKESLRHALIFSCGLGNKPLVDALFALGADANVRSDDDGSMPLEIATERKYHDLVRTLLEHGANPDTKLSSGMTSRTIARMTQDSVMLALYDAIPKQAK